MNKRNLTITLCAVFFFTFIPPSRAEKKLNILVYPFTNAGPNDYAWIAAGMTDTVIADLGKIREITVISERERRTVMKEIELVQSGAVRDSDVARVGTLTGAHAIFTGSYYVAGKKLRVITKLIDVEKGTIDRAGKVDGTLDDLISLQDRIVLDLLADTEKTSIGKVRPPKISEESRKRVTAQRKTDPKAFELYSRGLTVHDTEPLKALDYYKNALRADPDYFDAANRLIILLTELNRFPEAAKLLERTEKSFRDAGEENTLNYAVLLTNAGLLHRLRGNIAGARDYYGRAEELYISLKFDDTADYAALLGDIGQLYWDRNDLDRALEYYEKARALRLRLGLENSREYAELMNNMGLVHWSRKQYDLALRHYAMGQNIMETMKLRRTKRYASLMNNIGLTYWSQDDHVNALAYYEKAGEVWEALGMETTADYATLMFNMGVLYHKKRNDPCRGAEFMDRCRAIMKKINHADAESYNTYYGIVKKACDRR